MRSFRTITGQRSPAAIVAVLLGAAACTDGGPRQPARIFAADEQALLSSVPSAREGYVAVWDAANSREILFGGYGSTYLNDVWTLTTSGSNAYWVKVTPIGTAPSGRQNATGVWDATNSRLIIFGGATGGVYFNDVYTLTFSGNSATWAAIAPSGTVPTARYAHTAVWDPTTNRMIVYGGYNAGNLSDVQVLTFSGPTTAAWSAIGGSPPTGRRFSSAVWDTKNSRMLITSGYTSSYVAETWSLSISGSTGTWTSLSPAPSGRAQAAAVWNAATGRMIVFGGYDSSGNYRNDTMSFDGSTWTTVSVTGSIPAGRYNIMAAFDPTVLQMIVFGGVGSSYLNDTYSLSFATTPATWTSLSQGICETAPTTPTLSSPANGTTFTSCSNNTFTWSPNGQTGVTYSLLLNGTTVASGLTSGSYALPATTPMLASGNSWSVVANGCSGYPTASSANSSFDANVAAPAAPTLASPADGAAGYCSQTFSWNSAGTGVTYSLLINGSQIATGISSTSYTLGGHDVLANGTYTWQVKASNCANSATSASQTLVVDSTPPTPTLIAPADGAFTTASATFSWSAPGAAADVTYSLYIDGTAVASGLTTTSYTASSIANGTHTWKVTALGCGNYSATSATGSFYADRTAPTSFDLSAPTDNVKVTDGATVTLSWQASTDAASGLASYSVQLTGPATYTLSPGTATSTNWAIGSATSFDFSSSSQLSSWTLENAWGLRTWGTHSSLSSNPQYYANLRNDSATLATGVPISSRSTLTYWVATDLESNGGVNYDFAYLEILPEGGSWTKLKTYSGSNIAGSTESISLSAYAGQTVSFRFRIQTDVANTPQANWQGIAIDDFLVSDRVAEGTYTWNVVATDNVGNTRTSTTSRHIIVDRTGPSAPTNSTPSNNSYTNTTPTLTWTAATDSASGVCSYAVTLDGSVVASGLTARTYTFTSPLASGAHSWSVKATDCVGNAGTASTATTLNVDTTPPVPVTLRTPANNVNTNNQVVVSWNTTTDTGSGACDYYVVLDGSTVADVPSTTSYTLNFLAAGLHTWTVLAGDCVGNLASASETRTFNVDLTVPSTVTITAPTEGAWLTTTTPTVTWTAATDSSGIASYRLGVDTQSSWTVITAPTTSAVTTTLSQGGHCVSVRAVDGAGNTGDWTQLCFSVDSVAPGTPTLSSPSAGAYTTTKPTLSWAAATDSGSGICGYIPTIDGTDLSQTSSTSFTFSTALSSGSHSWTVRAVDCAGNQGTAASSRSFTVDTTGPSTPVLVSPATASYTASTKPTLSWNTATDSQSGVCLYVVTIDGTDQPTTATTSFTPSSALAEGSHSWTVRARDCVGNDGSAASAFTFSVDTTGPGTVTFTAPAASAWLNTSTPAITWLAATDSGSGVVSYRIALDGGTVTTLSATTFTPATALTAGNHCAAVSAVDSVGNIGSSAQRCFNIDVTAPGVPTLSSPSSGSYTASTSVTLTWNAATDAGSGICGYIPALDGIDMSQQTGTSVTTPALSAGTHTWTVRAVDCAGNTGSSATARTFIIDLTGPGQVTLSSPASGAAINTNKPTLSWNSVTDSGVGLCGYILTLDGTDLPMQAGTTYTPGSSLADGAHQWKVRARDCVGNDGTSSVTRSFTVDTVAPSSVSVTAPSDSTFVATARPTITWTTATDSLSGVASYALRIDGGSAVTVSSGTSYAPTSDLSNAQHCVTVSATDVAGNTSAVSPSVCFKVDTTGPSIPGGLSPSGGTFISNARGPFSWSASSDGTGSGVCGYIPTLDSVVLSSQTATSFQAPFDLVEGTHSWSVRAIDCLGNMGSSTSTQTFYVDLTAPIAPALVSPDDGSFVATGRPTLSWSAATDNVSGICRYTVTLDGTDYINQAEGLPLFYTPTTALADGAHTWTVQATNCVSMITPAAQTWTFYVDTTGPQAVTITSPVDGSWMAISRPEIDWTDAQDSGSGVASYKVLVDTTTTTVTAPANAFTPSADLSEGSHCVTVTGVDQMNNVGTGATVCFHIDRTPPTVPGSLSPAGNAHVGPLPTLSWQASTDVTGVCWYVPTLDGVDLPQQHGTTLTLTTPLSEAVHNWTVRAIDCVGNVSASAPLATFTIDSTAPDAVTLVSPVGGIYTRSTKPTFSWTATTDAVSGVCTYRITIDGVDHDVSASSGTTYTPTTALLDGAHPWTVRALDCLGNISTAPANATFTVDTTPPDLATILLPTAGAWGADASPDIAWTAATDSGGFVASYQVAIDSQPAVVVSAPTTTLAGTTNLTEGQHCVAVKAVDEVGNVGQAATDCFLIDLTAPSTPGSLHSDATIYGPTSSPALAWGSANDIRSGICGYIPTFDGTDLAQQTGTTLTIPAPLPEGTHTWTVRAVDCVGHEGAAATELSFQVDLTAPNAPTILGPQGGTFTASRRPALTWAPASDSVAGVCQYRVTLDSVDQAPVTATTFTPADALSDGSHTWTVSALDCVGNVSDAAPSATFQVDSTGPQAVTVTAPVDGSWVGTPRPVVQWSAAQDSGAGVSSYLVSVDFGTATSTSGVSFTPGSDLAGGSHCVVIKPVDAVGNVGAGTTDCFRVDLTKPTTPSPLTPSNGQYLGATPALTWTPASDTGSGVCGYVVELDSVALPQQRGTSLTPATLGEGQHAWNVRAVDCVGNQSAASTTYRFGIDLTSPRIVVLTAPEIGGWVNTSLPTLTWRNTTDDGGSTVCGYTVTLDGATTLLPATRTSLAITTALSEGSHTWNVVATDCVSNVSAPANPGGQFSVDLTAPSDVTFLAPSPGDWLTDALPTTTWSPALDSGSGLSAYIVESDDGQSMQDASATQFTALGALSDGSHCVRVRATDRAGNQSAGASNCFNVDRTPPSTPAPQSPTAAQFVGFPFPTFTWASSDDAGAGVCSYRLVVDTQAPVEAMGTSGQASAALTEGLHSWSVYAVDCAGNQGTASAPIFFQVDLTPPEGIDFTSPEEGDWTNDSQPQVSWSAGEDPGSGLAGYVLTVDQSGSLPFPVSQTDYAFTSPLAEGRHCAAIHGIDRVGHASSDAIRCFNVDLTPPIEPTLTAPADGACLGADVTFEWSAAVDLQSGVASYAVNVDDAPLAQGLDSSTTSLTPASAQVQGQHTWSIDTLDVAGNQTRSVARAFTVDTMPPTCTIRSLTRTTDSIRLDGVANDPGCGGVVSVEITVNDEVTPHTTTPGTNGEWSLVVPTPAQGMAQFSCRSTDGVGLQSTPMAVSARIDACFAVGTCDPTTHVCSTPDEGAFCDDGDACTSNDVCSSSGTCSGTRLETPECGAAPDGGTMADGGTEETPDAGSRPIIKGPSCSCSGQSPTGSLLPLLMLALLIGRRPRANRAHAAR